MSKESVPSLRAIEIGCGVGLAGLVALDRGLSVCFTDYDRAPLHFVRRSAHENGFDPASYTTRLLDWRDLPDETYPVILGSDVLYERRLVPLVASLLAKLLQPGGVGLIACPGRGSAEGFSPALTSLGLACRVETIEARSEDGQRIRGVLYRVTSASVTWSDCLRGPPRTGSQLGSASATALTTPPFPALDRRPTRLSSGLASLAAEPDIVRRLFAPSQTRSCHLRSRQCRLPVMSVEELQSAVAQLPAEELDRFSRWFEEFLAEQWDRQIEADILAGRLDAAGRRADEEAEAGRCTPLSP